jgi:two-component system, LytTR family, sensor kinase
MHKGGSALKTNLAQSARRCLRLSRDSAALWLPIVIALHILIVLHAAQWYAYAAFARDFSHPLRYLKWSMELWYTRAAMAPLVIYFALRYRFKPERWLRCLMIYTVITLVLATVASAIQVEAVTRLNTNRYFVAASEGAQSPVVASGLEAFAIKGWTHLIYNMFACWMLLGLVQGITYYRDAQRRELERSQLQTQLATMRLEILRMQLNPHFLFNTLHAISTLIKDEPQVAEDMILQLSDLLRSILDCNHLQEIPLRRELHFIESYLAIEQARFGERLTTSIDVPDELLHCPVPQLILQPLIENAIHHGIGENAGTDLIEIRAEEKEGALQLEVRNVNGVLRRAPEVCLRSGIGLSNTILRLEALYPNRATLQVRGAIPSGVAATILIPMSMERNTVDESEQVLT